MYNHWPARNLTACYTVDEALEYIKVIYQNSISTIQLAYDAFINDHPIPESTTATYPYLGVYFSSNDEIKFSNSALSYGKLPSFGAFGTTVTDPQLFESYLREQVRLFFQNYTLPIYVGQSLENIPLPFAVPSFGTNLSQEKSREINKYFTLPDLANIHDNVANGIHVPPSGDPLPLSLFSAQRIDLSLNRLAHYTGTVPKHFQRFVLFTNYQRYVESFIQYGQEKMSEGGEYREFIEPGDVITPNVRLSHIEATGEPLKYPPQMPAYHLTKENNEGITLINIGVGPSNAKTITDHLAVLRPHFWLMIGHCGGLRKSQKLGDYTLAHAYVRDDHVLDQDLPLWLPLPAIAEVQVALTQAVQEISKTKSLKSILRTGTIYTTDNRDWEFHHHEMSTRFHQSRAIAIDMESATIAANGFRLRVPYGTLLCISDKPMHNELKLRGTANKFYNQQVNQHLHIGIRTVEIIQKQGMDSLHSRKLRSFQEPFFR